MGRALKREAARRDLIAHWVWFAENASVDVADRFLTAVRQTVEMLASQPRAGTAVDTNRADLRELRRFPVSGEFAAVLLFYFPLEDGVELVRVLHGARDLDNLLEEGRHG